jgi:hypothetical protein
MHAVENGCARFGVSRFSSKVGLTDEFGVETTEDCLRESASNLPSENCDEIKEMLGQGYKPRKTLKAWLIFERRHRESSVAFISYLWV